MRWGLCPNRAYKDNVRVPQHAENERSKRFRQLVVGLVSTLGGNANLFHEPKWG